MTWTSDVPPAEPPLGAAGAFRATLKAIPLAVLVFGGLSILLLVRLVERPLCGLHRPVTPWITVWVCRGALLIIGLPYRVEGPRLDGAGAIVSNHVSWLDIFVLNAGGPLYFVSKSEVAGWPGIGWLARATGTLFIERDRRAADAQTRLFQARLIAGHRLLFFPEGTSTDGLQVLPFKPTLFQSFFAADLKTRTSVQPVTLAYEAPQGADPRFYGWWGDMDFGPHLLRVLAAPRQGRVSILRHPPEPVATAPSRKALAAACEGAVRAGLERHKKVRDPR